MTAAERMLIRRVLDQRARARLFRIDLDRASCAGCGVPVDEGPSLGCRACDERLRGRRRRAAGYVRPRRARR